MMIKATLTRTKPILKQVLPGWTHLAMFSGNREGERNLSDSEINQEAPRMLLSWLQSNENPRKRQYL
jgi:hypothetical protein